MEEARIIGELDTAVWKALASGALDHAIRRITALLARRPDLRIAWETLPLDAYPTLPDGIASSWVFVLRGGTTTGAERHPNSIQRVMSYRGRGDLQTWGTAGWRQNVLVNDGNGDLSKRWLSIPTNVWHRPIIPAGPDWLVISFHTAAADALIEERATDDEHPESTGNVQEAYAGRTAR